LPSLQNLMPTIVEVDEEEEEEVRGEKSNREAARNREKSDVTWRTCLGYGILVGIFLLEFIRTADQTLKDRAFELALDTFNHSLSILKSKSS
jgi:hypothetical protein